MLSRKQRLAVFGVALLSILSHPCTAGPIHVKWFTCSPEPSLPPPLSLPSVFPRPVLFPPPPTKVIDLGAVDLSHIAAPLEFRTHDPKIANATAETLNPWWFCQLSPTHPD